MEPAERERRALVDLAEQSADFIATADLEGRLTFLNRAGRRMIGVDPAVDVSRVQIEEHVVAPKGPFFASPVAGAAREPGAGDEEMVLRDLVSGTLLDVRRSTFFLRDPATGEPRGQMVMLRDVTREKAAERALKGAEHRLRAVLSASEVGLWQWDPQRDALLGDPNLMRLFGLEVKEDAVPIAPYLERIHADDRPRVEAALARALAQGGLYDEVYRVRTADGGVRWLHARGHVDLGPDGEPVSFPGIGLDVTPSIEAAERLRESDERYRALLESVDDGFCIIEVLFDERGERAVDYRFLELNASFGRQTGLEGAVGKTARVLVPMLDEFWYEVYGRVALTGEPARFERHEPAMRRWFEVEALPVGAPDRRRVAILFRDITARRSTEEALKEADRRKDAFIAILAHELRNPLAPVRTAVELLRRIGLADPRLQRARDIIERQIAHMSRLIDDLLDVSRIARGKLALQKVRCDLGAIARQTAEDYRASFESAGLTLILPGRVEPMGIEGDPVRLAQMIGNFLHNAGHFTERGGVVEVRAEVEATRRLAVVTISDTGVGIEPALLSRLFDPFSQADQDLARSKGGLGLGLALTKGLAELHGGEVSARSEGPGRGAVFTLQIPLSAPQEVAPAKEDEAELEGDGLHILVVEDNHDAAETLGELLELDGHRVDLAFDAANALRIAREKTPDVVISDIGLPGAIDGYGLARALRADPALEGICLIALSGYVNGDARRRAREAGFDLHLAKPPDLARLDQALAQIPRKQPPASAPVTDRPSTP